MLIHVGRHIDRTGRHEGWHAPGLAPLLGVALLLLAAPRGASWKPEGVDPYEVLGLKRGGDLSAAALKRAYRQQALRWHPDKVPESEREEAQQKFIEISWAYEVLGDPGQRAEYEAGMPPPGGAPPPGAGAARHSDFSMKEAAETFRQAFGEDSGDYQDLINHLMAASGSGGDKEHWQAHAEKMARATRGKRGDFQIETESKDGTSKTKTSRTAKDDGRGTRTETMTTEHTQMHVEGGPGALPGGMAGGHLDDMMAAHKAAHEAAVKAAQDAHRRALGGGAAHPGLPGHGGEL